MTKVGLQRLGISLIIIAILITLSVRSIISAANRLEQRAVITKTSVHQTGVYEVDSFIPKLDTIGGMVEIAGVKELTAFADDSSLITEESVEIVGWEIIESTQKFKLRTYCQEWVEGNDTCYQDIGVLEIPEVIAEASVRTK